VGISPRFLFVSVCPVGVSAQRVSDHPHWDLKHSCLQVWMGSSTLEIKSRPTYGFFTLDCVESSGFSAIPRAIPFEAIIAVIREVVTREPVREAFNQTVASMSPEGMYQIAKDSGEAGLTRPLGIRRCSITIIGVLQEPKASLIAYCVRLSFPDVLPKSWQKLALLTMSRLEPPASPPCSTEAPAQSVCVPTMGPPDGSGSFVR